MKWKKIRGFPYEVSTSGQIQIMKRTYRNYLGARCTTKPKPRKPRTNNINPHLFVDLQTKKDLDSEVVRKTAYIHLEVMKAFGPPKPKKGVWYCTHVDKDYSNNTIDNLRWISASESNKDKNQQKAWKTRKKRYGSCGHS